MRGIEKPFERWCRRADARALEALFDRAAPRLLRLGVHLVGDAAEAEDLVQSVFVALIEQRERIDGSRPAWPWLSTVLARKASDARRRAARAVDWEALEERLAEDASESCERRELSAELARALDRIDEPYRQPLVLRLRHGLNAAEIAHALDRSPATVRVQLHRARELLRPLLPASLATGLALLGASPRGLATVKGAVKAAVLREAALGGAVAGAGSVSFLTVPLTWGGLTLVSQKIALAALALIALAALVVLWPKEPATGGDTPVMPGAVAAVEPAPALAVERAPSPSAADAQPDRTTAEASAARGVRGRVVDAETGAPIEGASVRLFEPQEVALLEALRESPELFRSETNGRVRARDRADWPRLSEITPRARFGREPVRVYGRPPEGAAPLAEGLSDADGRFFLPADVEGGVLACQHAGYGARVRAAHDTEREWDLALWRERTLEGVVLTSRREPPPVPIRLAFSSVRMPSAFESDGSGAVEIPDDAIECLGVWTVECEPDGSFSLPVTGDEVYVSVLTPGWAIPLRGSSPVDQPLRVFVEAVPVLRVFDAASGVPVERVHLAGRESTNGYMRWSGVFDAPGGLLELPGAGMVLMSWGKDATSLTVWADGYAETRLSFAELGKVGVHDVPLERGGVPALEGFVHRGASAAAGAQVALLGHSALQWTDDEDFLVDADRADGGGSFRLAAPVGRYLLRVEHEGTRYFELVELVELPAAGPLDVDLDGSGQIDVLIADEAGAPRADHVVVLQGDDGRAVWGKSDAEGRHSFAHLPPQTYRVMAPFQTTEHSFSADLLEPVDLALGERREVRLELPLFDGPRHLRVHAAGTASYEGWRSRFGGEDWQALAADGTLPQDLATNQSVLEVESPGDQRWSLRVPREAQDGEVLELVRGTGSYSGIVRDSRGEPQTGMRVFAGALEVDGSPRAVPSVTTDRAGRFELRGLNGGPYRLTFRRAADHSYDFSMEGHTFVPDEPSRHAPRLELNLPTGLEAVTLRGVVLAEEGREPRLGYTIHVECHLPAQGGTFRVHSERAPQFAHTDAEGRFEMLVPDTPTRTMRVYREWAEGGLVLERTLEGPIEDSLELLVP